MDDNEPMSLMETIRTGINFVTWRITTTQGERILSREYSIEPRAIFEARQRRIMGNMKHYRITPDDGIDPPLDLNVDDTHE